MIIFQIIHIFEEETISSGLCEKTQLWHKYHIAIARSFHDFKAPVLGHPNTSNPRGTRKKELTMKKFLLKNKATRKRGLSDIFTVLLGLLIGVGLFAATMMIYKQTQNTSTLSTKIQQLMSISSEVEGIYATQPTYGTASADLTTTIKAASSLPDAQFNDVAIAVGTDNSTFDMTLSSLAPKICQRLALSDLGTNATADASDCDNGNLTVNYAR